MNADAEPQIASIAVNVTGGAIELRSHSNANVQSSGMPNLLNVGTSGAAHANLNVNTNAVTTNNGGGGPGGLLTTATGGGQGRLAAPAEHGLEGKEQFT